MKKVCVIKTDGTNCDAETVYAFQKVGAAVDLVIMYQLRQQPTLLKEYDILVLPGGFSYGDDVASGKIFAIELLSFLKDAVQEFVAAGKLVIGICNGFQVLVRSGLLPFKTLGKAETTLTHNNSGKFECRWVQMVVEESPCLFTKGLEGQVIKLPIAHAEGKFLADQIVLEKVEVARLIPLRYVENPNGSLHAIAGMCDSTGRIFGLMPHPERFVDEWSAPDWRSKQQKPWGLTFFENAVAF